MSGEADPLAPRKRLLIDAIEAGAYPSLIQRAFYPLSRLVGRLLFRARPIPLWSCVSLFSVFTLALGLAVGWGLKEPVLHERVLSVLVVSAVLGACTAIAAQQLTEMLLHSVSHDIVPAIREATDLEVVEAFMGETFRVWPQVWFLALSGPMVWVALFYSLAAHDGMLQQGWGARVVTLTACLQAGMALYYVIPVLTFLSKLGRFHLQLFPASPKDSQVMVNLQHTAIEALYVFAALFVLITLVASRLDLLESRLVRVSFGLLTWGPLILVFSGAQRTFTRIITRAKYHYLNQIQGHIEALQGKDGAPSAESLGALNQLLDYHDRIRSAPNSAIDLRAGLNFINALLLPLLAFLLANWDRIGAMSAAP